MNINQIAIFYWRKICNVKTFDLSKKKFRILTVFFWLIALITISMIGYFSLKFNQKYTTWASDHKIIVEYKAKFALNRFLERLIDDLTALSNKANGSDRYLANICKEDLIPLGYNRDDIANILNKISSQIIARSSNTDYSKGERALLDSLSSKLKITSNQVQPTGDLINNCCVYTNLIVGFAHNNLIDHSIYDYTDPFLYRVIELIHASNSNYYYTDTLNEFQLMTHAGSFITYWAKKPDTLVYTANINYDNLSIESALSLSKSLPEEYSIEEYSKKLKTNYLGQTGEISYYPNYLVAPFTKLSFYEPRGFNPADFKGNLEWAENKTASSHELFLEFLFNILIIFGTNIILIGSVRTMYWIING